MNQPKAWIICGFHLFLRLLRTKISKDQTKNHKDHRTNIIVTNFVWEQLLINSNRKNAMYNKEGFFGTKLNQQPEINGNIYPQTSENREGL